MMQKRGMRVAEPRVGVGVMIVKDGRVLLAQRKSGERTGWYGWIGGKLEFGETLQACALREAREEAGIQIGNLRLLCVSSIIAQGQHWVDVEFQADIVSGAPRAAAPHEINEWAWHPLDDLPGPIFEPAQYALEAYRSGSILNERPWK